MKLFHGVVIYEYVNRSQKQYTDHEKKWFLA